MKNVVLFALLLLALACQPAADVEVTRQAAYSYYMSPYSGVGVTSAVGNVGGQPWLIFWRTTDANCTWYQLSAGSSLANDVDVSLAPSSYAEARILGPGQTKGFTCSNFGNQSWTMGALNQNSHTVVYRGTEGADYMNCSGGPGIVVCYGNGGADVMDDVGNCAAEFHGGSGNDKLRANGFAVGACSTGGPFFYGDGGDDCLYSAVSYGFLDCGADNDSTNWTGSGTNACETRLLSVTCQ